MTEAQVQMVREEYRGPHDKEGHSLFDGGEPYGSELALANWLVMPAADAAAPGDTYAAALGVNYLNDMAFWSNPKNAYTLDSVPFVAEMHKQLQEGGGIYGATSPDLEGFRAHGGKIIIYHGWEDQAIPPFATIDYYRAVANQMGGDQAIQSFSRLYMIPVSTIALAGNWSTATSVQFMSQLSNWVEHGQAPGDIVLPVTAQTTGDHLTELTVAPFDPLKPAPHNNGQQLR